MPCSYNKNSGVRSPGCPSLAVPVFDNPGSTHLNVRRTQARPPPSRSISQDDEMNRGQVVKAISYGISSLEPVDDMSAMPPFLSMDSSPGFPCDMNHLVSLPFVPTVPDNPIPAANVPFASYQFLRLTRLSELPFEDVSFLELKGCFRVPESPYLDIFITKYFLYVHPCLPVIDEAEFWRMYRPKNSDYLSGKKMSLFVLQAMLFASSVFVPGHILNAVGFHDMRAARTALYQRAKLLFDFDTEIEVLPRAQGALLLTFQTTALDFFSGTRWLSVATQLAKSIEADLFSHDPKRNYETVARKRLWWCIILRDRVHSLALRRPTQVSLERGGIPTKYLDEIDLAAAVAHVALPLLLSTIDSGFSSTRLQRAGRRRQLHFYQEVMRVLGSRYEAADKVCAFIDSALSFSGAKLGLDFTPGGNELLRNDEYIEDLSDDDEGNPLAQPRPAAGSRFKNVCEYFARQPRSYLRLSLTLDYALYRGQYPHQSDIERLWSDLQLVDSQQPSGLPVPPVSQCATSWTLTDHQIQRDVELDLLETHGSYPEKDIGFDDFGDGLGPSNMEYVANGFISPASLIIMNTPLQ
ncbi:uncharacterized protein N7458_009517 [Penicillium daleae]|uniref:Xylanolytic transcriptional activator regulatory domain-containing protein n=1 Tax=Penicillium daleae TaxID=63821 RepID=A0AAD6BZV6_9EURO|nr:uncharacterized protein N7458_009517 [Penicillium daleae]KAJ5438519.1 hypothetical protein N7458_009517 [Penicillium daleae]